MKTIESKGTICIKGKYNLIYRVCDIFYCLSSDGNYSYTFIPNYSVIELIDSEYFQGIPGLNLDLKEEKYIRVNRVPTFISERVPSSNREDYVSLLEKYNMEYLDPIEFLIRSNEQYSGDTLFVSEYKEKETIQFASPSHNTNSAVIRKLLEDICKGNDIIINNQLISDNNRKNFHDVFMEIYGRAYSLNKKTQKEGIQIAKENKKYKGRKPISVDELKFLEYLSKVKERELSATSAAKKLGISIDKYYRLKKQLQK